MTSQRNAPRPPQAPAFATLATSARFPSSARAHCGADHDHEDFYVLFHTKLRDHGNVGAARQGGTMGYDISASADEIGAPKQVRFLVGNRSPRA